MSRSGRAPALPPAARFTRASSSFRARQAAPSLASPRVSKCQQCQPAWPAVGRAWPSYSRQALTLALAHPHAPTSAAHAAAAAAAAAAADHCISAPSGPRTHARSLASYRSHLTPHVVHGMQHDAKRQGRPAALMPVNGSRCVHACVLRCDDTCRLRLLRVGRLGGSAGCVCQALRALRRRWWCWCWTGCEVRVARYRAALHGAGCASGGLWRVGACGGWGCGDVGVGVGDVCWVLGAGGG
ncbi:uncharacterized protein K452DRAFT_24639 [Aplosporella prunicola CBS 121167]|uniref:Uncharacterized protein n=1 Tax=Aplosporella prunicola CBS 121167 TaxID=1176127 RepID=A0A6A6BGL2_9PEZI|nr:uncharacterized protein K452DRAFT_24639 [Aplosporella prunicola CBS 121167]KAF2142007.1 hypothetical protein K452DRAFT_24639 [Aplosporella prunicola CBS 121167]